jgi:hypothetical protein
MPQVRVFQRSDAGDVAVGDLTEPAVAVGYSTDRLAPRMVHLPRSLYRDATPDELAVNPRVAFYPKDDQAVRAERDAIAADIAHAGQQRPEVFTV